MKKQIPDDRAAIKHYGDLLANIKKRVRQAQNRAVMSVNAEMLRMYWDLGRMITAKHSGPTQWYACFRLFPKFPGGIISC